MPITNVVPSVDTIIATARETAIAHRSLHAAVFKLVELAGLKNPDKFAAAVAWFNYAFDTKYAGVALGAMPNRPQTLMAWFMLTPSDLHAPVVRPVMRSVSQPTSRGKRMTKADLAAQYKEYGQSVIDTLWEVRRPVKEGLAKPKRRSKPAAQEEDSRDNVSMIAPSTYSDIGPMRDGTFLKWCYGAWKGAFEKYGATPNAD